MSASKISSICLLLGLAFAGITISCSVTKEGKIELPKEGQLFEKLSDYGIFNQVGEANGSLVSYEVTNELFTDYAIKERFVYMPEGKTASLKENGFFDWPEGAMLVKNFGYSTEQIGAERLIETRLLIKEKESWQAVSYKWDEDQKDAKMTKVGDIVGLALNGQEFDYVIPNKNQCKSCHNHNEKIDPLGFKFANLGGINGQLVALQNQGVISLNHFSDSLTTMIAYNDTNHPIQSRALAYLDANCGHCHRPEGPGNTSGLFLQYDETRSNHLGFCKAPVAAGKGSGGRQFDITPGAAEKSILHYRMASTDPGVMMPEVGRALAHTEGLEIVEEWINSLEFDCYAD